MAGGRQFPFNSSPAKQKSAGSAMQFLMGIRTESLKYPKIPENPLAINDLRMEKWRALAGLAVRLKTAFFSTGYLSLKGVKT
jgi:hypothetical protein